MSNFEAKHPRAKDGKFTEKHRKESGITLELESSKYPEPKSTVSTDGRKMVSEHYDDNGKLERRVFRNGSDAGEAVETYEFYRASGRVWVRRYMGENGRRVRSLKTPNEEIFNYDGSLLGVTYNPTREQILDHLDSLDAEVVLEEGYHSNGVLRRKVYLTRVDEEWDFERNAAIYDTDGKQITVDWEEYYL